MEEVKANCKVSIHQSQYLPWSPYFKKIALSDFFVLLDDVQFQKNGVQNRNKLRSKNGEYWLTVPVNHKMEESISAKHITDNKALVKHWKSIEQSYSKAKNWFKYRDELYEIYTSEYNNLGDLNFDLIKFFMKNLKIETPIIKSSSLNLNEKKGDLVLKICEVLNADVYVSGLGSKNYLEESKFKEKNIEIEYLQSKSPEYQQIVEPFIADLSILDFIMNGSEDEIYLYFNEII
ncbi:WbqC family protein [Lysinibacillus sp. NPDC096212]|uniref:WbqC family protein n=1 Tax=Lysinibacillus sp. NPDC096212 TaxID=3364135 RepID=UPI00380060C9